MTAATGGAGGRVEDRRASHAEMPSAAAMQIAAETRIATIGCIPSPQHNQVAGTNFWAFAGQARPVASGQYWQPGDPFLTTDREYRTVS